jgi:acyl carrier protein
LRSGGSCRLIRGWTIRRHVAAHKDGDEVQREGNKDMEQALVKDQVRGFIMDIAVRRGVRSVADDDSLIDTGVLESVVLFRLVSFLEEAFSLAISDQEIAVENFHSINAIQEFVSSRLHEA